MHTGFGVFIKAKDRKNALRIANAMENKLVANEKNEELPFDYLNFESDDGGTILLLLKGSKDYVRETKDLLKGVKEYHCKASNFVFNQIGNCIWKTKEAKKLSEESDFLILGDGHE